MKILIAPDKFKGSLTALEVCEAVELGIKKVLPKAEVILLPLADGGEGSLDALESTIKFERKYLNVNNPLFAQVTSFYGIKNETAYIELAKSSGLQLIDENERNPLYTTSYGTGEVIIDAVKMGVKKIYLFIGGSATNDAGIGIASALGYKFFDSENVELKPIGKNLIKIKSIKYFPAISLENIKLIVLTDVKNPFYGKNGAAYVYGRQKGADTKSLIQLDQGLKNISEIIIKTFGIDVSKIPGSGAAGGIGGGAMVFCKANILSGIIFILEMLDLNNQIAQSDFIITGEGNLDSQTLDGKVVNGVIEMCKKYNKSIGILCGANTLSESELKKIEPVLIKSLITADVKKEEAIQNAELYLRKRSVELINDYLKNIK